MRRLPVLSGKELCNALAKEVRKIDAGSARWIASDAIRELTSEKVRKRLSNALAIALGCGVALDSKMYVSRIILC